MCEKLNILDFIILLLTYIFVILDMAIDDQTASMIFRL